MLLLYPGSFDPLHRGHLDIIQRAQPLCERLVVGVGHNPAKQTLLPHDSRVELARAELAQHPATRVEGYSGSTLAHARAIGANALLRGVRNMADLEFEMTMAAIHRAHGMETIFLLTEGRYAHISSSAVRLAVSAGLGINDMVTPAVARALERRSTP